MIISSRYSTSSVPPPVNAILDRNHPLSRGMLVCFTFAENRFIATNSSSYVKNYANLSLPGGSGGTNNNRAFNPTIGRIRGNTSFGITGQSGSGYIQIPVALLSGLTQYSMYIRATGAGNLSADETVWGDYGAWLIDNTASFNWLFGVNGSSSFVTVTVPRTGAGVIDDLVGTYDGATVRGYRNGALIATAAQTGGLSTGATQSNLCGDNSGNTNRMYSGTMFIAMMWNRTLTAGEVMALYRNPYQMFYSPARLGYGSISGPGGATVTMRRSLAAYGARAGSRQVHRS